jgi:hypothetical protein
MFVRELPTSFNEKSQVVVTASVTDWLRLRVKRLMRATTAVATRFNARTLSTVVWRLLEAGAKKSMPTMPSDARGAVSGDELATILKCQSRAQLTKATSASDLLSVLQSAVVC